MKIEIEKVIVELIQKSLNLPNNYGYDKQGNAIPCVIIKSQNIKLFTTPKIQVTVSTLSNQIYSGRCEEVQILDEAGQPQFVERIDLNEHRLMQVDIYSRNNEASQRYWEVQACLSSTLSQQLQEKYNFKIANISRSINLSGLDGGSDINRYTIRFDCLSWSQKINPIDYFDKFETTVNTEKQGEIIDIKINK